VAAALSADLDLLYVQPAECVVAGQTDWPMSVWRGLERGVRIQPCVRQGRAAAAIAEHADGVDADLVLITSRRYGSWRRFWRKSITDEVMKLSARAVCVTAEINADSDYRFRSRRILCVVGLDGQDNELIREAQDLATRTVSELVLLHVVPEASEALLPYAIERSTRPLSTPRAEREVRDLASRLAAPATTSVMVGDPGRCIAVAARNHNADLVLVSRHGGSLTAYGDHLETVLPRLHCPLLTVPVPVHARRRSRRDQPVVLRHSQVSAAIP
jgi:nucleotide-binding universal stress UspA family protein